ncbi:MAG TPA: saccharopine dehydrogenase NADP-binding domain-containing protein [Solirubrobacteraceae bacterium]|nr:saccharopine dehydrogenase NADP-binding domain-containing protein [Solirubrobacteraceae bacterium]
MGDDRAYDIVLFGATGFTGKLTAKYLAEHAPQGLRWAIAGRSREKLERLREELVADAGIIIADVDDEDSLRGVAECARIVVTTVGPYIKHGGPLVAACAKAGSAYLDLTGEPEFRDRMYLEHHAEAERTGARIIHACGFDSIPYDLLALYTVGLLPDGVPLKLRGFVRAGGLASGGTFHSAVGQFARARQLQSMHAKRRKAEGAPAGGQKVRAEGGKPYRESAIDAWAIPLPTIDPQIVAQSARLVPDAYGPDFTYGHYAWVKKLPVAVAGGLGVGAVFGLSQLPPTRALLLKARGPGSGPSEAQMEKGFFRVRMVGEGGGSRVVTQVSGGDPGYRETSKMLAEAALCLAVDDVPAVAGQVTTAAAMGTHLISRLDPAGIRFETLG